MTTSHTFSVLLFVVLCVGLARLAYLILTALF